MALILKNIFTPSTDEIAQNYTIESWHVSQSVDALTGVAAYDITISGSLNLTGSTLTGSTANITSITGSLRGIATSGSKVYIASNTATDGAFPLVFKNNTQALNNYHELASDTGGPLYNPSNNSLTASFFSGTLTGSFSGSGQITSASYAVTSSYAATASYLEGSVNTATVALTVSGSFIPTGSTSPQTPGFFKFISGYGITGVSSTTSITVPEIGALRNGANYFITTGISGSNPNNNVSYDVAGTTITFTAQAPNTEFTYLIMYR